MKIKRAKKIKEAQELVKKFAIDNGWKDEPNIDKFDHLHEELSEMPQLLRYKSRKEMEKTIKERKDDFVDGVGDLFFGVCRLANQLNIDIESAFNSVSKEILGKYKDKKSETKPGRKWSRYV